MKRKNSSFALAYVILVALPLLGLAGALKSGRTLAAPVSVGGFWKIQGTGGQGSFLPCGKALSSANSGFLISQSGRTFTLSFADSAISPASGGVEGATITANIVPNAKWVQEAGCGPGHSLVLTATVDSLVNPRFLAGALSVPDCMECAPVPFRAVRENLAKGDVR